MNNGLNASQLLTHVEKSMQNQSNLALNGDLLNIAVHVLPIKISNRSPAAALPISEKHRVCSSTMERGIHNLDMEPAPIPRRCSAKSMTT